QADALALRRAAAPSRRPRPDGVRQVNLDAPVGLAPAVRELALAATLGAERDAPAESRLERLELGAQPPHDLLGPPLPERQVVRVGPLLARVPDDANAPYGPRPPLAVPDAPRHAPDARHVLRLEDAPVLVEAIQDLPDPAARAGRARPRHLLDPR